MSESPTLTPRQRQVLEVIDRSLRDRGYPPSIREIGGATGLTSPSTVHAHLNALERLGYIRRDTSKPRTMVINYDPNTGALATRSAIRHVPLVGDVAAGTGVLAQENVEEVMTLPAELVGDGDLFMLRVRGDSMIDAGILPGDLVVARVQQTAQSGDIVIAGIPGDEATVKYYGTARNKVVLTPANERLEPMLFEPDEVRLFGKVVSVLRKL